LTLKTNHDMQVRFMM